jgi:hypothetical protein
MKGTFFDNLDIELYLTQGEFNVISLPKLEVVGNKLKSIYESLECRLQNMDGSDSGKSVHLECGDFEDFGDGISVEYKKETYFVKINNHASSIIDERGYFGTRYGMGEKIDIYISERMQV